MTDTPNAADLLCLTQWLSPAFPTGAFAYSHGLERVVATGTIHDAATLEDWLTGILLHGAGWQDAVLLAQGLRKENDLDALDALARALAPSAERLKETLDQGAALARTIAGMGGADVPGANAAAQVSAAPAATMPTDPAAQPGEGLTSAKRESVASVSQETGDGGAAAPSSALTPEAEPTEAHQGWKQPQQTTANASAQTGPARTDEVTPRAMPETTGTNATDMESPRSAPISTVAGADPSTASHQSNITDMPPRSHGPRTLPVALAEAARRTALPSSTVIALYLQGFAGNLVTIAVRHVPLGQTEGQTVLARLAPVILALASQAAEATLDDLGGSALAGDLAAFEHETQDVRIFRT
ncbi:hypothetical protein JI664_07300 [Rhodobacter sp. NTK016B]|uniref:urease accessory protein UreF n=1 Tax=Rhodobacter sp. NTK016B TaxID=2759676 RepID=UPI001A8DA464|nr:urease accessory UreF family protein [Rhodobacter sp. NTK016B]MBN8291765.1 hypothetical protein [Rhodobacter sp. NTK016B]